MKKVYVLDSSAFLSGFSLEDGEHYTVNKVLDELKTPRARVRAEIGLREGRLKIVNPPEIKGVSEAAEETGDIANLSEADIRLLHLAAYLKSEGLNPVIVTDDYSVQNVAKTLDLDFIAPTEKGITKLFKWKAVCKGCGKIFPTTFKGKCPHCGSAVKRRIYRDYQQ